MIKSEKALPYCGNDMEIFYDALDAFIEQGESYKKKLNDFFDSKDYDNYRIIVHALKSTSLSIGDEEFSALAKEQEFAAKEGNIELIESRFSLLLSEYNKILEQAKSILARKNKNVSETSEIKTDPATILVVDDDQINLIIAKKILSPLYNVIPVKSGELALKFLENNSCDLILLDILMPEMDGFEVMLNLNQKASQIPVAFLTADSSKETEKTGYSMGAVDFISKPFEAETLLKHVAKILSEAN